MSSLEGKRIGRREAKSIRDETLIRPLPVYSGGSGGFAGRLYNFYRPVQIYGICSGPEMLNNTQNYGPAAPENKITS